MSEVVLGGVALKELATTVKAIVHLMSEIANAQEDIKEQCEQLKEKVDMKPAEVKAIAKAVYDESYLDTQREKLESLEDMVEALEGKV